MAKSHESLQFCLRGFFILILVFEKEPGAAAPGIAEDLLAAPGLNLRRKRGLGFTIPRRGKGYRILTETSPFTWIFFLHFVSTLASEGIYLN